MRVLLSSGMPPKYWINSLITLDSKFYRPATLIGMLFLQQLLSQSCHSRAFLSWVVSFVLATAVHRLSLDWVPWVHQHCIWWHVFPGWPSYTIVPIWPRDAFAPCKGILLLHNVFCTESLAQVGKLAGLVIVWWIKWHSIKYLCIQQTIVLQCSKKVPFVYKFLIWKQWSYEAYTI